VKSKKRNSTPLINLSPLCEEIISKTVNLALIHIDGKIIYASGTALKVSGYRKEEFIGKSALKTIHPDDREKIKKIFEFRRKGKIVPEYELRIINKAGEIKTLLVNGSEIKIENQRAFLILLTDITEQKLAEKKLQETKDQLMFMFNNLKDAVYIFSLNPKPHFEYISPSIEELTGFTTAEHYKDFNVIYKYISDKDFKSIIDELNPGYNTRTIRIKIKTKNNLIKWIDISNKFLFSGNKIDKVFGSARDVTNEVNMQMTLKQNEERFRTTFDKNFDAFYFLECKFNKKGKLIDFVFNNLNTAAEKEMKVNKFDLIGKGICEVYNINKEQGFFTKYKDVYETGIAKEEEYHIPEGYPGACWYYHQVIPLENGVAIANKNITERKKAEDALRKNESMLRRLVGSADSLFMIFNKDIRYDYVTGPDRYKINYSDIVGKSPYDFFEHDFAGFIIERVKKVFTTGETIKSESKLEWNNKTEYFFDEVYPIRNDSREVISVAQISQNITELREERQMLAQLQESLTYLENKIANRYASNLSDSIKNVPNKESKSNILLMVNNKPEIVKLGNIKFIKASDNYSIVTLLTNKTLTTRKSLNEWEKQLNKNFFIRINRGTIINLEQIARIDKWFNRAYKITLKDSDDSFTISRRYFIKIKNYLSPVYY